MISEIDFVDDIPESIQAKFKEIDDWVEEFKRTHQLDKTLGLWEEGEDDSDVSN